MRLTTVAIDGLKNHRGTEIDDVPRLLAITGPNGSGKTGILSAIRIGTVGHEPAAGKKLEATRTLMPDDVVEGTVSLGFDNGFGIWRRFGASMETRVTPPQGEAGERKAQQRIDEETGAFILSFDFAEFEAKSAEKKREWLLATLPREALALDLDLFRTWLGYADAEAFVRQAIDKLWTKKVLAESSVLDGLAAAITTTREVQLEAQRKRHAQEAVARKADARAKEATETTVAEGANPEDLEAIAGEVSAIDRRIGAIDRRISEAEAEAAVVRKHEHRLAAAEYRIETVEAEATKAAERAEATCQAAEREARLARSALEAATQRLSETGVVTDQDIAAIERRLDVAEKKARSQREAVRFVDGQVAEAKTELAAVRREASALDGVATCPTCGSKDNLPAMRAALLESIPSLEASYRARSEELEAAIQTQAGYDRDVEAARKAKDELRARATARTAAERDVEAARRVEAAKAAALDSAHRSARDRADDQARAVIEAKAELERLREDLPAAAPDVSDLEDERDRLAAKLEELHARTRAIRDTLTHAGKAEAARETADRERADLAVLEKREEALTNLFRALQRLRAHVVDKIVAPVEETANEILAIIDPAKRFRFLTEREGRPDFDFGFEEDGAFRSYGAASTGESADLFVVLVAALIAVCRPAWRVLLVDNVEAIDEARIGPFMRAIASVSDRLDNVIIAGCHPFPAVDGWEVLELPGKAAAERVAA